MALSRIFPEFLGEHTGIFARREALGPSRNEGLCYEGCYGVSYTGEMKANLYFALDGYTRLKILPRLAEWYRGMMERGGRMDVPSILTEFTTRLGNEFLVELQESGVEVESDEARDLSHKLIPVDLHEFRQYILIFFLKERKLREYMGRAYLILTISKG